MHSILCLCNIPHHYPLLTWGYDNKHQLCNQGIVPTPTHTLVAHQIVAQTKQQNHVCVCVWVDTYVSVCVCGWVGGQIHNVVCVCMWGWIHLSGRKKWTIRKEPQSSFDLLIVTEAIRHYMYSTCSAWGIIINFTALP